MHKINRVNDIIVSLTTPQEARLEIASSIRQLRLDFRLTQQDLADKSGVAIASLRKFERTGVISLESFLKLAVILGVLDKITNVVKPNIEYDSIDQILAQRKHKPRKRVRK